MNRLNVVEVRQQQIHRYPGISLAYKAVSKFNEKLKFPPIGGWQYMPSAGRDGIQLHASVLSSRPPHHPYVLQLFSGNQNVSSHVQRKASAVG